MAIAGIPEVIHNFNMYNTGNKLVGITGEVPLPDLEAITATIAGAGLLGEYESPVPGHFGSLEQETGFRVIAPDYFKMADPTQPVELVLRGAIQYTEKATQKLDYMGMRVVFRGRCKKMAIGTVKQHDVMDSSITQELTYYMVEMDGKEKVCLDKINGVYRINGVDVLSKVRQLT